MRVKRSISHVNSLFCVSFPRHNFCQIRQGKIIRFICVFRMYAIYKSNLSRVINKWGCEKSSKTSVSFSLSQSFQSQSDVGWIRESELQEQWTGYHGNHQYPNPSLKQLSSQSRRSSPSEPRCSASSEHWLWCGENLCSVGENRTQEEKLMSSLPPSGRWSALNQTQEIKQQWCICVIERERTTMSIQTLSIKTDKDEGVTAVSLCIKHFSFFLLVYRRVILFFKSWKRFIFWLEMEARGQVLFVYYLSVNLFQHRRQPLKASAFYIPLMLFWSRVIPKG